MSNFSQSYQGQISILEKLIVDINRLIRNTQEFSILYKDEIDKTQNRGMMLDYIDPLKAKGYPVYKEKVQLSIDELIKMRELIKTFIEILKELQQVSTQIENTLV